MFIIITLYDSKETDFSHNGLAVLENVIRCEVEEELNGFYGLELEYPIFDKKIEYLIEDNIIKVSTPRGQQLFRIYRKVKTMASVIYYARHCFYDLLDNFIESYRTGKVTGNIALQGLLNNTQYPHNFKGSSDVNKTSDAFYVRKNPVESLIGDNENSFIRRWGGDILRDNFNISILSSIGADRGVTISYGKNLLGLEEDLDNSEVVTRIMPTGLMENDSVIMLEEKYIDSPNIEKYPFPKIKHLHFSDINVDPEKNITLADVKRMLREKVQELYQIGHIDIPKTNYKVDFVELSKTEEYKNYSCLESVNLGDIVTVKHLKMGINIRQKVIKYKWDCILNKYLEIELGSFKENLATDFNNISNSIEDVKENIEENNKKFRSVIDKQDDRITLAVEEIGKNKAQIEITARSIISTVEDKENKLNSKIEQTASSIKSEVNDEINKCNSRIEQKADSITSTVNAEIKRVDNTLSSYNSLIEQKADSITSTVNARVEAIDNTVSTFSSKIEQTAEQISSKVSKDNIVSEINQSAESVTINASKIDFSGVATYSSMENNGLDLTQGKTIINGGKLIGSEIVSGSVDAQSFHSRGESYFYNNVIVQSDAEIHGYLGMQTGQCAGTFNIHDGYCYKHFHIGDADISGDLEVKGKKNRVVNTEHYGKLKLNAVESTECWFEDIGRGKLKDRKCIIRLDKKFLETVNMDIDYEVQTWAYGNGNIWVDTSKMYKQYVVIEGNADIEFGYKIIAKQKQYENVRLEESTKKAR